jgi:energy-coupling factor transporter transmembrane protein EcfT
MFKLNNLTYILLSLLYFLVIVCGDSISTYLTVISLTYLHLIVFNKFKLKIFLITLLLTIPTWLSFYLATNVFAVNSSLDLAISLTARVSAITISSIMLVSAVDFEELLLFLMQYLRLPAVVGYPFLSAVNALKNLKNEYIRIKNAYLIRYGARKYTIAILYPMLISATRYAYHNGLSMECRGLNRNKTYIHKVDKWSYLDTLIIIINIVILISVVEIVA